MKYLLLMSLLASSLAHAQAPVWFSDYVKSNPGCEQQYLCVVGDGETLAEALSQARLEASKYFQIKIQSKSQISSSSQQKGITAINSSFDEWTNKTINEETSEMISGLEIKRQEEMGAHVYVLMALDRMKTAKALKEKVESLDNENAKTLELNSRFAYSKIMKNLSQIGAYSERYNLLGQVPLKLKVKRDDIHEKINNLRPLKMGLTFPNKLSPKLQHTLVELLSPLKIVIVSKKSHPKYILRSEVIADEQYFKVSGFRKLNVILRLELINSNKAVLGKLSALSEQVARTNEQAIENAIPEIKEALLDNLHQLSTVQMED